MHINTFEKDFSPTILGRGIDYYERGKVIQLEESPRNYWHARVKGK
ncbi:MAG: hypothetical protein AAFO07_11975 [Bacteroidota bacterium]